MVGGVDESVCRGRILEEPKACGWQPVLLTNPHIQKQTSKQIMGRTSHTFAVNRTKYYAGNIIGFDK